MWKIYKREKQKIPFLPCMSMTLRDLKLFSNAQFYDNLRFIHFTFENTLCSVNAIISLLHIKSDTMQQTLRQHRGSRV